MKQSFSIRLRRLVLSFTIAGSLAASLPASAAPAPTEPQHGFALVRPHRQVLGGAAGDPHQSWLTVLAVGLVGFAFMSPGRTKRRAARAF
ncbi:MAG: hypothetical protein JO317_06090 [Verrucomicrobiae bacterium]|nr:hypothetical protein [Verrucomicrobiae bacterium]